MNEVPVSRISRQYDAKKMPFGLRFGESQRGCLQVFGSFFLLPGICIITILLGLFPTTKYPEVFSGEWFGLMGLGVAFAGFGTFMVFYRDFMEVDAKKLEIRRMSGLFIPKLKARYDVTGFKDILLTRQIDSDSDGDTQIVFHLMMTSKDGQNVSLGGYSFLENAIQVGLDIAGHTGLKFFDATVNGRRELTLNDISKPQLQVKDDLARYDTRGAVFKWDNHVQSLSRLYTAQHNGQRYYKIADSKYLIMRLVMITFSYGFFIYFIGWDLRKILNELVDGFMSPQLFTSVEVFFTTMLLSFWTLFLIVLPFFMMVRAVFLPAPYSIIGVAQSGLYLRIPKSISVRRGDRKRILTDVLLRYQDIHGIEIKAKDYKWKAQKIENFIGLRAGAEFYELASGLDKEQLEMIAADIKTHLRS